MARLRVFRRRTVPVPTLLGGLLLVAFLGGTLLLALRPLAFFLAQNAPVRHGILVVEGWLPVGELGLASEIFRQGGYEALVVTGGPVEDPLCEGRFGTYAERAAAKMRELGIAEPALVVVPAPASAQDRTYRNAVSVRQWIEASGQPVRALDVFSQGTHSRRSRLLYQIALGDDVAVGVRAAPPYEYGLSSWWRSSRGAKDVIGESIYYAWTLCCFDPGPRGSHQELWAEPEPGAPR